MYIIVIGCGRVGAQLASFLSGEGHDVVVIDTNPKAFRRLGAVFNGKTFVGVGFDIELLKKAGAEKADAVAVVTDLDNTNIMVAQVAKKIFNISKVITRLYNPDRFETYQKLGLDVICGTSMLANAIKDRISKAAFESIFTLPEGEVEIIKFRISPKLEGKMIRDIEVSGQLKTALLIRGKNSYVPYERTRLIKGDILIASINILRIPHLEKLLFRNNKGRG